MVTCLVFMWKKANIFFLVLRNRLHFHKEDKQEMSMLMLAARSENQTGTSYICLPVKKFHVDLDYALLNFSTLN